MNLMMLVAMLALVTMAVFSIARVESESGVRAKIVAVNLRF